ncbi:hypothetical protein KBD18_01670 [Patescibacteria group bacterium]|nr:hypothetical protein [Patescibacteria group bacterium]
MFFRTLCIVLFLAVIGVLEHTFFAGLAGGIWPADMLLGIAVTRMTAIRGPGVWPWVLATALFEEIFSYQLFGVALMGTLIGLTVTRTASYSLFSHHSFFARASSAVLGIVSAIFSTILLEFLFALAARTAMGFHSQSLAQGLTSSIATTVLALIVLAVLSYTEPKMRWIFRSGTTTTASLL